MFETSVKKRKKTMKKAYETFEEALQKQKYGLLVVID